MIRAKFGSVLRNDDVLVLTVQPWVQLSTSSYMYRGDTLPGAAILCKSVFVITFSKNYLQDLKIVRKDAPCDSPGGQ
jgi:hypothetical protein